MVAVTLSGELAEKVLEQVRDFARGSRIDFPGGFDEVLNPFVVAVCQPLKQAAVVDLAHERAEEHGLAREWVGLLPVGICEIPVPALPRAVYQAVPRGLLGAAKLLGLLFVGERCSVVAEASISQGPAEVGIGVEGILVDGLRECLECAHIITAL